MAELAGGGQIQARPREGSGFEGGIGSATSGFWVEKGPLATVWEIECKGDPS